jgi:hypothetical protein
MIEYDYIKDNYCIFFLLKDKNEANRLKNFLKKLKFYVYKNIVIYNDKYIIAVDTKRKTIFELIYLTIIASYYCNNNNIQKIDIKFRKVFTLVFNLVKSLQLIFNTLINYKVSVYKNNVKIDKNIFKVKIDKKDEIIIENLKIVLIGEYNNFLKFLNKLSNKSKNVFVKKIIYNFLIKKINKQQKDVKKEQEQKIIESILNI